MKKRTIILTSALLVIGLGSLLILHKYKLELIHTIVVNAVIQKSPPDYPAQQIRAMFDSRYQAATTEAEQQAYLLLLLEISRRIEKVQLLDRSDLAQIERETRGGEGGQ